MIRFGREIVRHAGLQAGNAIRQVSTSIMGVRISPANCSPVNLIASSGSDLLPAYQCTFKSSFPWHYAVTTMVGAIKVGPTVPTLMVMVDEAALTSVPLSVALAVKV